MARRRFISNGIWTNPKFVSCSIPARLLFIGLVSHADDEGRLGGHPVEVGLQVFPADRVRAEKVDGWLAELSDVELVLRYSVEGRPLLEIPKFQEHQDSRYRVPSQIPSFQQSGGIRRHRQQVNDEVDVEVKALDLKIDQGNYLSAPENGAGKSDAFETFWQEYPKPRRKGKFEARRAWTALRPTSETVARIMRSLAAWKASFDWLKEGGKWIPWPQKFLNRHRWEEIPDPGRRGPDELEGL